MHKPQQICTTPCTFPNICAVPYKSPHNFFYTNFTTQLCRIQSSTKLYTTLYNFEQKSIQNLQIRLYSTLHSSAQYCFTILQTKSEKYTQLYNTLELLPNLTNLYNFLRNSIQLHKKKTLQAKKLYSTLKKTTKNTNDTTCQHFTQLQLTI